MFMIPLRVFSNLFFLLLSSLVSAMDVDALIEEHIKARGGQDKWRAVRTMKITGTFTAYSTPGPFTLLRARPHRYFLDHILGHHRVIIGFDGEIAWWRNPWYKLDWPVKMSPADRRVVIQDAEFATPLFSYLEEGHQVEFMGKEALEDGLFLRIRLTRAGGEVEDWYLDPETYLEHARKSTGSEFGKRVEQITYFSEFKNFEGLLIPHMIETEYHTRYHVWNVESVEINPKLAGEPFRLPLPEGMVRLRGLIGTWSVKVFQRPSPRSSFREQQTTSRISSVLNGALLEERFSYRGDWSDVNVVRHWSYDRFDNIYRMSSIDDFTSHLNVMQGSLENESINEAITVDNLETGTSWRGFGYTFHERLRLSRVTSRGFEVERETSIDGGRNWFVNLKMVYQRAGGEGGG